MATVTYAPEAVRPRTEQAADVTRRARPVLWWAGIGAAMLALIGYTMIHWVASGDAHSIGTGVTPVPTWMKWSVKIQEIGYGIGAVLFLYFMAIRPWRRAGQFTFDALFVLAFVTVIWLDPGPSYFALYHDYNSYFFNLGGWAASIPGWQTPNGQHIAQPIIWDLGAYLCTFCAGVFIANALMHRAKARWPRLGNVGLVLGSFVLFFLLDLIAELAWIHTGAYQYGSTISGLTISSGHWYQFPIYESLWVAVLWTMWSSVRYFRNDQGQTLIERGIDEVRVSARTKTALRFVALVGVLNVIYLAGYILPMQFFTLKSGPWPADTQTRSYFTNGLCGEGTTFACGVDNGPIPSGTNSIHLDPNGRLVVPEGASLPTLVRHAR
jgi:hypothetical protein